MAKILIKEFTDYKDIKKYIRAENVLSITYDPEHHKYILFFKALNNKQMSEDIEIKKAFDRIKTQVQGSQSDCHKTTYDFDCRTMAVGSSEIEIVSKYLFSLVNDWVSSLKDAKCEFDRKSLKIKLEF